MGHSRLSDFLGSDSQTKEPSCSVNMDVFGRVTIEQIGLRCFGDIQNCGLHASTSHPWLHLYYKYHQVSTSATFSQSLWPVVNPPWPGNTSGSRRSVDLRVQIEVLGTTVAAKARHIIASTQGRQVLGESTVFLKRKLT